jgi:hypothetical protein
MKRWRHWLFALAMIVVFGGPMTDSQSPALSGGGPSAEKTVIEILDEIDACRALSPAKAGEVLGLRFEPVLEESDRYTNVFRGHGGLWSQAELRLPPTGDGGAFVLVLIPKTPIPMKDVIARFGKEFSLDPANPSAGDKAMVAYSYDRKIGKLRFSFKDFDEYAARIILFDRM